MNIGLVVPGNLPASTLNGLDREKGITTPLNENKTKE